MCCYVQSKRICLAGRMVVSLVQQHLIHTVKWLVKGGISSCKNQISKRKSHNYFAKEMEIEAGGVKQWKWWGNNMLYTLEQMVCLATLHRHNCKSVTTENGH